MTFLFDLKGTRLPVTNSPKIMAQACILDQRQRPRHAAPTSSCLEPFVSSPQLMQQDSHMVLSKNENRCHLVGYSHFFKFPKSTVSLGRHWLFFSLIPLQESWGSVKFADSIRVQVEDGKNIFIWSSAWKPVVRTIRSKNKFELESKWERDSARQRGDISFHRLLCQL